jgi:hypothetical protein
MFWKLIKFGYHKEHGLWNSTTRFYDENEAWSAINQSDEDCVLLEIRSDGYWEIVDSKGMDEPGLRVTDKGFGVQIVEKDPDFINYYQHWVMCNV